MAIIGMDIHRAFAELVALEGKSRRRLGRIDMRRDRLAAFAAGLAKDDIVVVEATGNAAAVAEVLAPHVGRVVIANPKQVRAIGPRKSTSVLSPAGTEMAQRCARALQKRSDNNGCATRLSPQTLLFATQSLARLNKIAEDSQENRLSITSVCQGDAGAVGLSRMPIACNRRVTMVP